MVDYEDSYFIVSTSLKNETTPFPNRFFDYDLVKSKSSLSNISEVNLHSNHYVECKEAWGGMHLDLHYYAGGMQNYHEQCYRRVHAR